VGERTTGNMPVVLFFYLPFSTRTGKEVRVLKKRLFC